jgi:hypothetical protein
MLNRLLDLVCMNLTQLSIYLPLVVHTDLSKYSFLFAVLSRRSFADILNFDFQQLFDTLEELADTSLKSQTILSQQGCRMGLDSFVLFCT